MNLYAIRFGYSGDNYYGWQKQKDKHTVQEELESALSKITGHDLSITASGRTDTGVSAISQVATFFTSVDIDETKFVGRMNYYLSKNIKVYKIKKMHKDFHVMHSAIKKHYEYNFYLNKYSVPYLDKFATRFSDSVDIISLENNLKYFIGTHDFTAFCNNENKTQSKTRTVFDFRLIKKENYYTLKISGDGFLYHMIRIIVGTLVDISLGRINLRVEDIMLSQNRLKAGRTADAIGLVMLNVEYEESI